MSKATVTVFCGTKKEAEKVQKTVSREHGCSSMRHEPESIVSNTQLFGELKSLENRCADKAEDLNTKDLNQLIQNLEKEVL